MKKLLLLGLLLFAALSQNDAQTISGTVLGEDGEALIGVNILEKGTINGAVTDLDGKYSLTLTTDPAILVFSYTGLETQEISVDGRTLVHLVMQTNAELLDEVVVTALGFTEKRDEMGSTSSIINPDDVSRSGETTILNALGAKASNVVSKMRMVYPLRTLLR